MDSSKPKVPKKGGGNVLKKLYEDHRNKSKPSPELIEIIKKQKIEDEEEINKKSAVGRDLEI